MLLYVIMKKAIFNYKTLSLKRYRLILNECCRHDLFPSKKILLVFSFISLLSVVKASEQEIIADSLNKGSYSSGYSVLHYSENEPSRNLVILGDKLYGTELMGGVYGGGRLFRINTDGSDYKSLYDFTKAEYDPASLAVYDSVLYGTTSYSGGYLFRYDVRTNGPWKKLAGLNCYFSWATHRIIISDGIIYGIVTEALNGKGRIFRINIDGTGYKALRETNDFTYSLICHEGYLYCLSMGYWTGQTPPGTLYRIKTDGTDYKLLHTFTGGVDGWKVRSNLVLIKGKIYSMTQRGGAYDAGILYRINPDGTGFEVIDDIPPIAGDPSLGNCIENIAYLEPYIYATQNAWGENSLLLRGNEESFEILWEFESPLGGYNPGEFVIDDGIIYGMTYNGGWYDYGVIYKYVIGDLGIPDNRLRLPVKRPVQLTLNTRDDLEVEINKSVDLDTTFSVKGNIQYLHSWKVKSDYGYDNINKIAHVTRDSTFYLFITTSQGCSYFDSVTVKAKISSGKDDLITKNQITIFPNPNTGVFKIKIPDGNASYSFNIFEVSGINIANGIIDCPTEECIIDVELPDVAPGVYYIIINKNYRFYSRQKFIISK